VTVARQLTVRAAVVGALLGVLTGASNLYVGLKTGWSLGVVLTASVLGWALWRALLRLRVAKTPMSTLELNAMASTASAAGYSTGVNLVSAVAGYAMITGAHLPLPVLWLWTGCVAGLGLGFAMLVKHRLLDVERLPFPTGRAAAETLQMLVAGEGQARARWLLWGAFAGAATVVVTQLPGPLAARLSAPWVADLALPQHWPGPGLAARVPWVGAFVAYGWTFELSGVMVAAGILTGVRTAVSVALGTVVGWGVLAPWLVGRGLVPSPHYADVVGVTLWVGVPLLLGASAVSLVDLAGGWRRASRAAEPTPPDAIPRRWFWISMLVAGPPCVVLQVRVFSIPPVLAVAAIGLALLLTIVAARVTGETDVTPTGPLGKVTQLAYGAALPGATVGNLMATGVTAGAATSAADLLTDLKSGWILKADPRQQVWAQTLGALVGTLAVVPLFTHVLVPDPSQLGTATWPAPAARVWLSVAELMSGSGLPPSVATMAAVAGAAGVLLAIAGRRSTFVPSPTGIGIGILIPASSGIGFLLGGVILLVARRRDASRGHAWVTVAAGIIVGESVFGLLGRLLGAG
jgi:uncharacterized oligopeptide transporter (OPT) family protein